MKYWYQNVIGWFKTMYAYAPILWEDRDWDHIFILGLLRFKLSRVETYFRKHGVCTDNKKQSSQVKEALNLLDQMILDDFCGKEHRDHDKKWGKNRMSKDNGLVRSKIKTYQDKELERKEFLKIMNLEVKRRDQTWAKLFNHLNKHMMGWWD